MNHSQDDFGKINLKKALGNGTGVLLAWAFRVGLVGIFFWFKAEFVLKEKYLEDQTKQIEQWTKLTSTLTHIDDALVSLNKVNDSQDKAGDDREKRIRELEKKIK